MRSVQKSAGAIATAMALLLLAACGSDKKVDAKASDKPTVAATTSAAVATDKNSSASVEAPASSSSDAVASTSPAAPAEKVKLSVVSLRPGSEKEAFAAHKARVAEFMAKNPDITIEAKEYEWNGVTFAAQLAGGTVPTVFTIPFTDGGALIQRKQISDITKEIKALPYGANFNQAILKNGQDADGNIYAVPTEAYANGLHYNRKLFKDAGLDPDKPPTTWAEVRAYAKQITEKTGKPGYVQMTKENTGGWMLTNLTNALGGRMETAADGKATATVNNAQAKQALEMLKEMRFTDKSMGANFLLNWPEINAEFAAGKVGMYTQGADVFTYLVQSAKIDPAIYGLTTMPLGDGPEPGVLGGGTMVAVKAGATDAEKAAAAKWIDFFYLSKLTNQEAAVADAKLLVANKQSVGTPALPIFDQATLDTSREWIKEFINVPVAQMKPYADGIAKQALVTEMPVASQAVYGVLDKVVQAVLTNKGANIDDLLKKANDDAQKAIDKAAKEAEKK